jgi:FtsZ-binding cell division protein ZapB
MTTDWSVSSEYQYRNEVLRIINEFYIHATTLRNRAPAVVLGIQDANNAVSNAKSAIENGISLLQTRANELKSKLQSMLRENEQSASKIQSLEREIKQNKEVVKEAEVLADIRKEQAAVLHRKGDGNFHSSWMGLWRPLSEESRLGLIIASICFGLIALILFGFYAKLFLLPVIAGAMQQNSFNFQIGSGRQRKI